MMPEYDRTFGGDIVNAVFELPAGNVSVWVEAKDPTRNPPAVRVVRHDESNERADCDQEGVHDGSNTGLQFS